MKTLEALIKGLQQAKEELSKAIKPGPTLDYSKINAKPDRAAQEAAAPTINYNNNRMANPTYSGAMDRATATRAKLEAEAGETALDTINRRQKVNKNTNMSYEGAANQAGAGDDMAQSEAEPHKDDPHHEAKEKVAAKKIKEEAEDILDLHKDGQDIMEMSENGQWNLKKDNSVKPFGQSVYNSTANIKRKANRTGEVQEGVGRNNAVHSYTTSGSSVQAAHEAKAAKDAKANPAPVKTLANMSPEEKAKLETQYGAKIKKGEDCYKAETHSVFTMQHAHEVADMPHHEGQAHLHKLVDSSTATPENKAKIKASINSSKNPRHLSSMVANHVLAAGGAGHKPGSLKVLK